MSSLILKLRSWVRFQLEQWIFLSSSCLATGWSSVQWVLPNVHKFRNFRINSEWQQARGSKSSRQKKKKKKKKKYVPYYTSMNSISYIKGRTLIKWFGENYLLLLLFLLPALGA
jgi:hypothetical protein